jgi:hypothetical protein
MDEKNLDVESPCRVLLYRIFNKHMYTGDTLFFFTPFGVTNVETEIVTNVVTNVVTDEIKAR